MADVSERLASARSLPDGERQLVVDDLRGELRNLRSTAAILRPDIVVDALDDDDDLEDEDEFEFRSEPVAAVALEPGEVELHISWADGQLVVWAGGRGRTPDTHEELSTRLEKVGAPPHGWQVHPGVALPGAVRADALAISVKDALGWLVAIGGDVGSDGVGASARWLGRVALEGVRLAARGAIVPSVRVPRHPHGRGVTASVQWRPALVDSPEVAALVAAMPGTVTVAEHGTAQATAVAVIGAVVEAIVAESIVRMVLPASPPSVTSPTDMRDALIANLDGTPFQAPSALASDVARMVDAWTRPVISGGGSGGRPRLVVQLDAPGSGPGASSVWLVTVTAPTSGRQARPIDAALRAERGARPLNAEWTRLGRLFPAIHRSEPKRRGRVALSQDEAWTFMTDVGPTLAAAGFDVRVPALSLRKATPSLRLFAESPADSVVGARQLTNVAWSVLFDDVELTAAEIAALARQARPLVETPRGWVEVDRADLAQAAAALAERENITQLTGAEILRHSVGLESSGLRGGVEVRGHSWATEIIERAESASTEPVPTPGGFAGELRTYQAEALGWLGFLDSAELGGCLALDMGLGKTPTVLAHLARTPDFSPTLVIAPAAVVGNWHAEAARFVAGLRILVHHGAERSSTDELADEVAGADVIITTYATAVRDIEALADVQWGRVVLDEAQAIKNPLSETAQMLRRIPARSRLALTGTPIENGLGDLWSILDFTNPGLVGSRADFIAQMSGDGEAALRALNGIVLFRRTKLEPEVAAELPDKIDELDHCTMTEEQIGMYQAVLDTLVADVTGPDGSDAALGREHRKGAILAAITALKQICNHPAAYRDDGRPLAGRSGKLDRLEEIVESVFAAGERVLVFTHFAAWGRRLAAHLTEITGVPVSCYDGSLARGARDRMIAEFQRGTGPGALVLSLKAGGTGLNLTGANHVVLYDRWWNPAVEDQARDRAWRIGQQKTVISHRLVCPGTVDERVEEIVAGKRHVADVVLPKSSSLADLDAAQIRLALGLRTDELLREDES